MDYPQQEELEREAPAPKRRKQSQGGWMGKAALCISLLALVLAAAALAVTLRGRSTPAQEEPDTLEPITFTYRDQALTPLDGVAVNSYVKDIFAFDENGRAVYASESGSAKVGVDVSFHQGDIDWAAVAADGVDFAMIRLGYRGYTQGGLIVDTYFYQNIQGALDAGLDVGVYFFSQAVTPEEAQEEADFVCALLADYNVTYPVAFDWEYITSGNGEARTVGMTGETLTQCVRAFCDRVAEKGYETAVYFNQDMAYLTLDLSQLTDIPFWLAEYGGAPDFYYDFDLWQYTAAGSVAGIEGKVDLDLDLRPAKA
jgi:GH25 family lysozyme M1 (1,4-beta-N-acetylmuramidase)